MQRLPSEKHGTRPRAPHVVALVPVPVWLAQLAGVRVERAAAWATEKCVLVRVTTSDGWFLVEHVAGQGWFRVSGRSRSPLGSGEHAELFAERMRWIAGVRNSYEASPEEEAILSSCDRLAELRQPSAAHAAAWRVQGVPHDVRAYLGLLSEPWHTGSGESRTPAWLKPFEAALNGDFAALRELATHDADGGPLANLIGMVFELAGFHEAARAAYEKGVESVFGAERADVCIELAKLCRAEGDSVAAIRWARSALLLQDPTDSVLVRACAELVQNGAFDDAHAVLEERCAREPFHREAALSLAELLLWAHRTDSARTWLARAGGDDFRLMRATGVVLALEGHWAQSVEAFLRANELCPGDVEVTAWLSESKLRLGEREEAARWLALSRVRTQNAVHIALTTAIHGTGGTELAAYVGGDGNASGSGVDAETERAAFALLSSFGGNRGELLTSCRSVEQGLGLELVPRPLALSPRDAAADVLRRIGTVPLEELERALEALGSKYPDSAHPFCYWGELELWLGAYERAIELFERALSRQRVRWAYVGTAAARVLLGDYAAADAQIAECERWFEPVLGATTPVYMGEAHRRRGDLARAKEMLQSAVDAKPGRAGAWMNLALAELALGRTQEATRIFDMLTTRLPRLYADAWSSLNGEPVWPLPPSALEPLFERTLEMMRGNRSSHTLTYFDPAGDLRIAQPAERWLEPMARHAPFVAMDLRRRLALGLTPQAP